MKQNLQNHYQNIIMQDLLTKLNFKNIFEIPKITKICLNLGFKNANIEKKKFDNWLQINITKKKYFYFFRKTSNIYFTKYKSNKI